MTEEETKNEALEAKRDSSVDSTVSFSNNISDERREEIISALQEVEDPELHIDIYTLGLIYAVKQSEDAKKLDVTMTLTSPMCPFGPMLMTEAEQQLKALGYAEVTIDITFDPVWEPSDDLRMELGLM